MKFFYKVGNLWEVNQTKEINEEALFREKNVSYSNIRLFIIKLQIFVNGERFASFAHRVDPHEIGGLQIQGDLDITGIQIV